MEINPLKPSDIAPQLASQVSGAQGGSPVSFKTLLTDALSQVNNLHNEANASAVKLASGEPIAIDEVMLAMQKADLALQLTQQIRNKLIEAYQEVSRMQI